MLFYVLECKVEHCTAEFYLNDIPVIRRGPDIGDSFGGPVNHLIVDGVNKLEMVIEPGPHPDAAVIGGPDGRQRLLPVENSRVWAALTTYPKGAVVEGPDRKELVAMEWKAAEATAYCMPLVQSVSCDLGQIYGPWQWQRAERLSSDDATRIEAFDFILNLHGSLVLGDFEALASLSQIRNQELDRAYGKAAGATAAQLSNLRADCLDDSFWGMNQLQPESFSLRLCGHDRLIECVTQEWQPVLEELPDQEESIIRYPMIIGKIDGQWQILR